jgi:basic membrane lipoprotein Med (substrate-binding protein (PBP1-ABC) superfamily)
MKKFLAVVVASAIAVMALAGCGGNAQSEAESVASEAESVVESAASEAQSTVESAASAVESAVESVAEPAAEEPTKVALIFNSSMNDGGWNWDAYQGMEALAAEYNLAPSYQENVGDDTVQDVLRNYAAEGYPLIVDAEQYHCELMLDVCAEYPDTTFVCLNGYVSTDNMITLTGDMWQHLYVAGVAGAGLSETKKIGLITYSTDSNSALTMKAALAAGAKSYDPSCEIVHVATGSFSDLQKGIELSNSLLDQGCDVIVCNSGDCNPAVYQNVTEKGYYAIGCIVDHNHINADYMIGSAMMPSSGMLRLAVEGWLDGSNKGSSEVIVGGLKEGFEEFRWNENVKAKCDPAIVEAVDAAIAAVEAGEVVKEDIPDMP